MIFFGFIPSRKIYAQNRKKGQWVKVLHSESEGSLFKPHCALSGAQRPKLVTTLPVTVGSNVGTK